MVSSEGAPFRRSDFSSSLAAAFSLLAAAGAVGILLLLDKDILYAGIAFGIGIREFLLAFKS